MSDPSTAELAKHEMSYREWSAQNVRSVGAGFQRMAKREFQPRAVQQLNARSAYVASVVPNLRPGKRRPCLPRKAGKTQVVVVQPQKKVQQVAEKKRKKSPRAKPVMSQVSVKDLATKVGTYAEDGKFNENAYSAAEAWLGNRRGQ